MDLGTSSVLGQNVEKSIDAIQTRLADYALGLRYEDLPAPVIYAAKLRLIDTLAALIGGFEGEPSSIAREVALVAAGASSRATIIGTRTETGVEFAAFANATAARFAELNDIYRLPGASFNGHPSDVIPPVLSVAECVHSSGRELITAIVLGYEVFCRICDAFNNRGFDNTNFSNLAIATASGKLLRLTRSQLLHSISIAAVSNAILKQVRTAPLSMWKAVAAGHAGRAGVFAALLARADMEGPHLPFEGQAGCVTMRLGGGFH